jgi:hypothetical protein
MNDQLKAMAMDDMVASAMRAKGKASKSTPQRGGRATRRMGSGLLENAPKPEAETKSTPASTSGTRRMRSGGGDYPFTKNNTAAKSAAATGAAARAGAMTAAKVLGPAAMLAASEKAAGATPSEEMSMMRQSMQNPSSFYNTMGPGSVKNPAYSGQSTMSKLMGVGKKGK